MRSCLLVLLLASSGLVACGGSDECGEDEVEVTYLGTSNDRTVCEPIPAACNGTAMCIDDTCRAAMYGLCESPAVGVGCSDTFAPTIISCNE